MNTNEITPVYNDSSGCFFPGENLTGARLTVIHLLVAARKTFHLILISCIHGPQSHKISVTTTTLCTNISLQSA